MKRIRYTKYVPDPAGEMSMEDLLSALSDYLLQSGFQNSYSFYDMQQGDQTLDELKKAIEQALIQSDFLDEKLREQLEQMHMDGKLEELIEQLVERHMAWSESERHSLAGLFKIGRCHKCAPIIAPTDDEQAGEFQHL